MTNGSSHAATSPKNPSRASWTETITHTRRSRRWPPSAPPEGFVSSSRRSWRYTTKRDLTLAAQLRGILGTAPDAGLIERIHQRTEGNAFFSEELVAAGGEAAELPASLRDVLMLRTEALSEPAQAVLRAAAAHGRVVTHRLLAAVCELPAPQLAAALREAAGQQVLVRWDEEAYAFRHALLHETVAADL